MNARWKLVGALVLGSVIVACAQQAMEQMMAPDGGGNDGASHAGVPATPAGECCETPPPQRTVLYDGKLGAGCLTPEIDITGQRRVVVHHKCTSSFYAEVRVKHGEAAGFVTAPLPQLCEDPTRRGAVSLDAELGEKLKVYELGCNVDGSGVTVVGYR